MANFEYEAINNKGEKVSGQIVGKSRDEILDQLREKGLQPTKIVSDSDGPAKTPTNNKTGMSTAKIFIIVLCFLFVMPTLLTILLAAGVSFYLLSEGEDRPAPVAQKGPGKAPPVEAKFNDEALLAHIRTRLIRKKAQDLALLQAGKSISKDSPNIAFFTRIIESLDSKCQEGPVEITKIIIDTREELSDKGINMTLKNLAIVLNTAGGKGIGIKVKLADFARTYISTANNKR
jgi:hypothetical protein